MDPVGLVFVVSELRSVKGGPCRSVFVVSELRFFEGGHCSSGFVVSVTLSDVIVAGASEFDHELPLRKY